MTGKTTGVPDLVNVGSKSKKKWNAVGLLSST